MAGVLSGEVQDGLVEGDEDKAVLYSETEQIGIGDLIVAEETL